MPEKSVRFPRKARSWCISRAQPRFAAASSGHGYLGTQIAQLCLAIGSAYLAWSFLQFGTCLSISSKKRAS